MDGRPLMGTMHGPWGPSVAAVRSPGGQVTARTNYDVIGPNIMLRAVPA